MPHPSTRTRSIEGDIGSGSAYRLTTHSQARSETRSETRPFVVGGHVFIPKTHIIDLTGSSHKFSENQHHSTPMGRSTQASAAPNPGLAEQKKVIMEELRGSISKASDAFSKSLYTDVATDTEIDSFLKASRLYSRSRWAVPRRPKKESDLYGPFAKIAASVIKELGCPDGRRRVQDSHAAHLQHQEDKLGMPDYSSPDLVILGSGPSFETTPPISNKYAGTYSDIASCLEVKLDSARGSVNDHVQQLGIYARQMFIQQPNRRFVRSLIVTQENVRLFHFDRSGVQHTGLINIHEDPHTFIRLLLGLSSLDEQVLGFDTSIQWTIINGRKVRGTIATLNSKNELATYEMVGIRPSFIRHSIRGRGTVCWTAVDPAHPARTALIKDSWRSVGRKPEFEFLELARGLKGVAQIISYENRGETKDFRGDDSEGDAFHNRIETRVTMESYGASLAHFKSEIQLIRALRDAIAGHRNLLDPSVGILHRDISINNILLSKAGRREGGVLIDLDMAILIGRHMSEISTDCRTGTRRFQSIAVLMSYQRGPLSPPHDYLDDLESFFYVLCFILHTFDVHGSQVAALPELVHLWDLDDPSVARMAKESFMYRPVAFAELAPFWSQTSKQLLKNFHHFIRGILTVKADLHSSEDHEATRQGLSELLLGINSHYEDVLRLFDDAIQQLSTTTTEDQTSRPTTPLKQHPPPLSARSTPQQHMPSSPLAAFSARQSSKRSSGEDPEGAPSFKRSRTSASTAIARPSSLSQSLGAE